MMDERCGKRVLSGSRGVGWHRTIGYHECDRPAGHRGQHTCVCQIVWSDIPEDSAEAHARREVLRRSALAKLTPEEREALGFSGEDEEMEDGH